MSERDELRSWHDCGQCGESFIPGLERIVFCSRCSGPHTGLEVAFPDAPYVDQIRAWLDHHAFRPILVEPGFGTYGPFYWFDYYGGTGLRTQRLETRQLNGFRFLVEHGHSSSFGKSARYTLLRLSTYFPHHPRALAPDSRGVLTRYQEPDLEPRGLRLLVANPEELGDAGIESIMHALIEVAQRAGALAVHDLRPSTRKGRIERGRIEREVEKNEGTARCQYCGAPVTARELTERDPTCPFCGAGFLIPEPLKLEVVRFARSLRAQDPRWQLDGPRLMALWTAPERAGVVLACPVCGAPRAHAKGVRDERCTYCEALIVPSAASENVEARLAGEDERQAKARHSRIDFSVIDAGRALAKMVGGGVLLVLLILVPPLLAFLAGAAGGYFRMPNLPLLQALVFVATFLLLFAMLALVIGQHLWLRRARAPFVPVYERIAEQLEATRTHKWPATGHWCRENWPHLVQHLNAPGTHAHQVFQFELAGFPALIQLDPNRGADNPASSVRVFVAARWDPSAGALKDSRGIVTRRRALAAAGFETTLRRGGLSIRATPELGEHLRNDASMSAIVVPIVFEARRIIELLGAHLPDARVE